MSSINPAATLGPVAEGLAPISFNPVLTTKNRPTLPISKDNEENNTSPKVCFLKNCIT